MATAACTFIFVNRHQEPPLVEIRTSKVRIYIINNIYHKNKCFRPIQAAQGKGIIEATPARVKKVLEKSGLLSTPHSPGLKAGAMRRWLRINQNRNCFSFKRTNVHFTRTLVKNGRSAVGKTSGTDNNTVFTALLPLLSAMQTLALFPRSSGRHLEGHQRGLILTTSPTLTPDPAAVSSTQEILCFEG